MDEFFRNMLKDHSSPVPEDMWQRIMPEKDKDRKGFILWYWYFFGGVLFIAIITAGYFIWHTNTGSDKKNNIAAVNKSTNNKSIVREEEIKKDKTHELKNTKQDSIYQSATNLASASKMNLNGNTNEIPVNNKDIKNAKTDKYTATIKVATNRNQRNQKIRQSNSSDNSLQITTKDAHDLQGVDDQSSSTTSVRHDISVARIDHDSSNNKSPPKKSSVQLDSLKKQETETSNNQSEKKASQSFLKKKDWFLEVYGSPDLALNYIYQGYYRFHQRVSYTIGARLGTTFGKHLSAKVGIQFTQLNVYDGFDSLAPSRYIHYKSVDAPLLVGYKIKKDHFSATIDVGLIFNIYSWCTWSDGQNAGNIYRKNTGLSLYLGLNYVMPLNDRLLIFTEPYFRYRLSNMAKSDAGFTQKINVAGLTLGARYNFIKKHNK